MPDKDRNGANYTDNGAESTDDCVNCSVFAAFCFIYAVNCTIDGANYTDNVVFCSVNEAFCSVFGVNCSVVSVFCSDYGVDSSINGAKNSKLLLLLFLTLIFELFKTDALQIYKKICLS